MLVVDDHATSRQVLEETLTDIGLSPQAVPSADVASMVSDGTFTGVILHEMGHVIGIGTLLLGLLALARTGDRRAWLLAAAGEGYRPFQVTAARSAVPACPATITSVLPATGFGPCGARLARARGELASTAAEPSRCSP